MIYNKSAAGYELAKEIRIPWMAGVFDYWPESGTALIEALNHRHIYATYYRFNIETKRRVLIGLVAADDILFLKDEVIRTIDSTLGGGPMIRGLDGGSSERTSRIGFVGGIGNAP